MEARYSTTGMQFIPYKAKDLKKILNARSVYISAIHQMDPVTAYVMKDGMNGKRLVTYHCHSDWLKQECPDYEITNMPKNHVERLGHRFRLNDDIMPNEVQSMAIDTVIERNLKTAFFNIPTGVGKTLMAIYLTSILGVKAWATCYRTTVLKQWVGTLADKTTFDISRALIVSDSKTLLKMACGDFPYDDYDFYLSTPMLLIKFSERYGLDLLNDVMDCCGIGVKFYDEAHKNVGNMTKINGLTNVDRTYYLSADFNQSNEDKAKLYFKMFNRVPIIRPDGESIRNQRYTVGVMVKYNTHPTITQEESCFRTYGFDAFSYMNYQVHCDEFWRVLGEIMLSIRNTNLSLKRQYRTLIMCNLIAHVDLIMEKLVPLIRMLYKDFEIPKMGRYHSKMEEDERRDTYENAEIIVSTYQSMGVGIDMPMIRYVVNLSPLSIIDDNQAAGRARALADGMDCYYFLFVDEGFRYITKNLPKRTDYLMQQKLKTLKSIQYS